MAFNTWKTPDGRAIDLLTPEQLRALPLTSRVVCIDGATRMVGLISEADRSETRAGLTAYGIPQGAVWDQAADQWKGSGD